MTKDRRDDQNRRLLHLQCVSLIKNTTELMTVSTGKAPAYLYLNGWTTVCQLLSILFLHPFQKRTFGDK